MAATTSEPSTEVGVGDYDDYYSYDYYGGFYQDDADYYGGANYSQYPELGIADSLALYFSPIILVLGWLGNLVAIVVLGRLGSQVLPCCFYLLILALSDLLRLCHQAGNDWAQQCLGLDIHSKIKNQSDVSCQVYSFLFSVCSHLGSWMLAVAQLDYIVAHRNSRRLTFPQQAERTKHGILLMTLFIVFLNIHFFWTFHLSSPYARSSKLVCDFAPQGSNFSEYFREVIWPITDIVIRDALPDLITFCCLVYRGVAKVKRTKTSSVSTTTRVPINLGYVENYGRAILVVGAAHLCLTLPQTGNNVFEFVFRKQSDSDMDTDVSLAAKRILALAITSTLKNLILALKTCIYIIVWYDFRERVSRILGCWKDFLKIECVC